MSNQCLIRHRIMLGIFVMCTMALLLRIIYLQFHQHKSLHSEGEDRQVRTVAIPKQRGMVVDRNGEALAVSIPAQSAYINPQEFSFEDDSIRQIAEFLALDASNLRTKLLKKKNKQFAYVKRQLTLADAEDLEQLKIHGLYFKHEYRRFYPMGEATAHLIGVTKINELDDDGAIHETGLEGVERAFNTHLYSKEGRKQIRMDLYGRVIDTIKLVKAPHSGNRLYTSIDKNIQYFAYRALKVAVNKHKAKSGSIVVLDTATGEVLAMVNQPSFNPNNRSIYEPYKRRNRAAIDEFEPGSVIKPFIVAALLDYKRTSLDTKVQTSPGYRTLKTGKEIKDVRNFGEISVRDIIVKSSNVGISDIALRLSPKEMWSVMSNLGFGQISSSSFPGESSGHLRHYSEWKEIDQKVMSFGYGISVSTLQLARAYTALANDGWMPRLSLYKIDADNVEKDQVFSSKTAKAMREVLFEVTLQGTGREAQVLGFTTAGKTGTVRKAKKGEYQVGDYVSLFSGFAPAHKPKIVIVVMIDEPSTSEYYGGKVAAPVFSEVATNALRVLKVPEDYIPSGTDESLRYTLNNLK